MEMRGGIIRVDDALGNRHNPGTEPQDDFIEHVIELEISAIGYISVTGGDAGDSQQPGRGQPADVGEVPVGVHQMKRASSEEGEDSSRDPRHPEGIGVPPDSDGNSLEMISASSELTGEIRIIFPGAHQEDREDLIPFPIDVPEKVQAHLLRPPEGDRCENVGDPDQRLDPHFSVERAEGPDLFYFPETRVLGGAYRRRIGLMHDAEDLSVSTGLEVMADMAKHLCHKPVASELAESGVVVQLHGIGRQYQEPAVIPAGQDPVDIGKLIVLESQVAGFQIQDPVIIEFSRQVHACAYSSQFFK